LFRKKKEKKYGDDGKHPGADGHLERVEITSSLGDLDVELLKQNDNFFFFFLEHHLSKCRI
jgi:hypothetical protein